MAVSRGDMTPSSENFEILFLITKARFNYKKKSVLINFFLVFA